MSYKEINKDNLESELYRKEYYEHISADIINKPDNLKGKYLRLNSYQLFAVNFTNPNTENGRTLIAYQPGCHPYDTEILMHDGSIKKAGEIKAKDVVAGPSGPNIVITTRTGYGKMYRVKPNNNDSYECSKNHIHHVYSLEKMRYMNVTTHELIIKRSVLRLCSKIKMNKKDLTILADLIDINKSIYKDGKIVVYTSDPNTLYFARKCGLYAMLRGKTIEIWGNLCLIPSKIIRELKILMVIQPLTFSYEVEELNDGKWFGMELSGDKLYYLAKSYIITHNSGKTIVAVASAINYSKLYKFKYNELKSKLGYGKHIKNLLDEKTPSIFVLGYSSTMNAVINELLRYTEFGFITPEELSKLNSLVNTPEYKEFYAMLKHRITNKSKGGFFTFYGYQTFVNRLFSSETIKLTDLDKILVERRKVNNSLTLPDLFEEFIKDKTIEVNTALLQKLEGSFLICDEVHHTYNSVTKNNYGVAIQYILDKVPSLRIMMLTATPINNSPSEIVEVMSYLTGKKYNKKELFTNNKYLKDGALQIIQDSFIGKVCFLQDINPNLFPDMHFIGESIKLLKDVEIFKTGEVLPYLKFIKVPMSPLMIEALNEIITSNDHEEDEEEYDDLGNEPYSFHKITPSKYTIFDGVFPGKIYKMVDLMRLKNENSEEIEFKEENGKYFPTGDFLREENVGKYFPKSHKMLEMLEEMVGVKVMIIHPRVAASGVMLDQELLLMNGYIGKNMEVSGDTRCSICGVRLNQHPNTHDFMPARFLIAHSNMDKKEIEMNINLINQDNNLNGEHYKIFIGSTIIKESYTFLAFNEFICRGLPGNIPGMKQFIGRVKRNLSHAKLPSDRRYVNVNILLSTVPAHEYDSRVLDVYSPEEYKYIDKMAAYLSIQQIERVMNSKAVDSYINRSIIMPPELKERYAQGEGSFNSLYFDVEELKHRELNELQLSTFYAYKYYVQEVKMITFIVKRLFYDNIVWTYDDLWKAVQNPPFGVEYNTKLFAEGNFVRVLVNLCDINLFKNIPVEKSLGNMFDDNFKIIIKDDKMFKIVYVEPYYILCEYNLNEDKVYINPNMYLNNIKSNYELKINVKKYIKQNRGDIYFKHVYEIIQEKYDVYKLLTETSTAFQEDLIRHCITHKNNTFDKFAISVFDRLGILVTDSKKVVGYRKGLIEYIHDGNGKFIERYVSKKEYIIKSVYGYIEDVDYFMTNFKIKPKSSNLKDKRLEKRGIVCETKDKGELLVYLAQLGFDVKKLNKKEIRIKNICGIVKTLLIDKQLSSTNILYFKHWAF